MVRSRQTGLTGELLRIDGSSAVATHSRERKLLKTGWAEPSWGSLSRSGGTPPCRNLRSQHRCSAVGRNVGAEEPVAFQALVGGVHVEVIRHEAVVLLDRLGVSVA